MTIDTLRADRLAAYGGPAGTTPHLDRIAGEGALVTSATAHVPLTRPSHVSMFTGLLPWQHGIRDNISPAEVPPVPLLAEVFKGHGFATAAFVSSVVLSPQAGLGRGFDVFDDGIAKLPERDSSTPSSAAAISPCARPRDGSRPTTRKAAFSCGFISTTPTTPTSRRSRTPRASATGPMTERPPLPTRSWASSTPPWPGWASATRRSSSSPPITAKASASTARRCTGSSSTRRRCPFPSSRAAPASLPGTRVAGTVGLADLYPTLPDLAGVSLPAGAAPAGRSLAPALRGGPAPPEKPVYAESLVPLLHFGWSDLRVLREGRWKYIQAPRPELYDLAADPGERSNVASAQPARAAAFQSALGLVLDDERRLAAATPSAALPMELLEKLGALGYVGGAAPAQTSTPGADPKDKIAEFRVANALMRDGIQALGERKFAASAARFEELLRRGIESFEAHYYLGRALAGLGRHAEAAARFEEAVRRAPALADGWTSLARARLALGQKQKAREAYERALPLAPRDAALRVALGELSRDLGDLDGAITRLREAVALDPANGDAWNSLGMTLGGRGRFAEAEAAFREAIQRNDREHRYAYNLGLALLRQGRARDARPFFEKSLALEPRFAPAREQLKLLEP